MISALEWQVPPSYRPHRLLFTCPLSAYPDDHPDRLLDTDTEIDNLKAKVDAGADFIITQLFYDVDGFLAWLRKVRHKGLLEVPFSCSYLPHGNFRYQCPHHSWSDAHTNLWILSTSDTTDGSQGPCACTGSIEAHQCMFVIFFWIMHVSS